jgi:hypothetical protein
MEPLDLSLEQQFEVARFGRVIDETTNVDDLKKIAKQLLQAWISQKAVTAWVMKDSLTRPSMDYTNFVENNDIA